MIIANLIAIFRKELQGYFASPFAYMVAAVFWLISGIFFTLVLYNITLDLATQEQNGITVPRDVAYEFLAIISLVACTFNGTLCRGTQARNVRIISNFTDY
jgi:ABC-2 type transport system permease protein